MTVQLHLSKVIAPSFKGIHRALKAPEAPTHVWLKGGRGSTKSSYASVAIILGIMQSAQRDEDHERKNAVVIRKVADTLRDSVYEQMLWAIEKLGVSHLWHQSLAPLRLTYRPTGQRIVFKGADDPAKLKSIKFSRGVLGYVWFEELAEFPNMENVRTILQSLLRGTDTPLVFYTYNPPQSVASWVNTEAITQGQRADTIVHHSTYLDVPPSWLGPQFLAEAEHLKMINPRKYAHEYMGEPNGTGGEVFTNTVARRMSDAQIAMMDKTYRGIDFGFAADPTAYAACYYNPAKSRLVIFDELYQLQLPTRELAAKLKAKNPTGQPITADSAEPRTIHDLRSRGVAINSAKKGPGSVEHGIKWLADLAEIIIDPVRCPNTLREFQGYEVERDHHGNLKGTYPDKNNHSIDAVRYATESIRKGWLL